MQHDSSAVAEDEASQVRRFGDFGFELGFILIGNIETSITLLTHFNSSILDMKLDEFFFFAYDGMFI